MEEILIQIYDWFFGNPYGVTMAIDPIVGGALIGGAVNLIGGLFGGGAARRRERRALAEKRRLEGSLDSLEKSIQNEINYNYTDEAKAGYLIANEYYFTIDGKMINL